MMERFAPAAALARGPVLALSLLLLPAAAQAGPIDEAMAAVEQWAADFNRGDVGKLVSAYTPDASVYVTAHPKLLTGSESLGASFAAAARAKLQVRMGWTVGATALSADAVVLAGYYEFGSLRPDGQLSTTPARYSIVLSKRDGRWLIAHHHSSEREGLAPARPSSAPNPGRPLESGPNGERTNNRARDI